MTQRLASRDWRLGFIGALSGFSDVADQMSILAGLDERGLRAALVIALAERRGLVVVMAWYSGRMRDDEARRARAQARAAWPITRVALADECSPDVSALDAGERVAMVWALTLDAWASAGLELPSYSRAEAVGRMVRGGNGDR